MQQALRTAASCLVKQELPELPYAYNALEPVISCAIMELHHTKHHKTYVDNFNIFQERLQKSIEDHDPTSIIQNFKALQFNGGGHINHTIFWRNLTPDQTQPSPELCKAIDANFGGMDEMKSILSAAAVGLQGSGWAWLGYDQVAQRMVVKTTNNQDPLEATTGLKPLLGIDVWEHAYYLQYQNVRPAYVKAIFDVVNWNDVSKNFAKASC
ncbi:unnamed protein product [Brassicogethes aeneus]|uniref:Superoxide dismutase n=1 Tax=Brassicogethes aeneus TaxID=1431903 RepID=A0A9P0F8M7_BRAAE|nr:unnamed protein product [Brassicogethes aeneus]